MATGRTECLSVWRYCYPGFDCVDFSGVLERLFTRVDQQQGHMASCGLLDSLTEGADEEEMGDGAAPGHEVLLQLARRAQLWPVLEQLAILNQMKVTTDLLHLSVMQRYYGLTHVCRRFAFSSGYNNNTDDGDDDLLICISGSLG